MRRRWHAVWVGPLAAFAALFVWMWMRAGWDLRYLVRVLVHRESSTSDLRWKDATPVAATHPAPWRERPACDRVRRAFDADMDAYLTDGGALGLVVVHDGALACEWYGNGGDRDRPAMAFSVSKTVIALLVARAVADGTLRLDDPITRYVPALAARDPRFAAITIADLVDMRSGIAFRDDVSFPWVDDDAPAVYYASDLAATVVDRPRIDGPPGTFVYNDYAPNLVGLALEQAYGARLATGPMQALWSELGAEDPAAWLVDGRGFAWHESGFVVTARDLARVGQRALDAGDRARDPAGREAVVRFAGAPFGYRNGWWTLGDHALVAMGRYGQIVVVSFATHTVIVRLGLDGHDETNAAIARRLLDVADRL